jgi:hypothetical protein
VIPLVPLVTGVERSLIGEAHHRPAGDDPAGVGPEPAAVLDQLAVADADRDEEVLGLRDAAPRNRHDAVGQRLAAQDRARDRRGGADVDDDDADVERQAAGRHLEARRARMS